MAIDPTLHFLPWEDRPAGCSDVVWRYSQNPIIPRDLIPTSNSIFNSAVVPYNGEFRGVFRADNKKREMNLHSGSSKDGIQFHTCHLIPLNGSMMIPNWQNLNIATIRALSGSKTVFM